MPKHWIDKLVDKIRRERGDKDSYVLNCGMSISGMMHIGNLRGELMIPSRVSRVLEKHGKDVSFRGVYYTQDRFKAKEGQIQQFEDPDEAKKYKGWRLIDLPDPDGCHKNWVDHFNSTNHPFLKEFDIEVDPITTTDFYKMKETKEIVKKFLENKERVREVINRFRDRNPKPEGWIPFDPLCNQCNRIDTTEALEINFEKEKVRYRCKDCGHEGWSDLNKGKLAWRLEWSALWHVLDVDFEPFGKDHATPGGSRDSCIAISKEFGLNYPTGFSFNWVYWKENNNVKEMTSSGDIGMTAKDYLDVAEPEVLTYLYLSTKPAKEIYFSPEEIPTYHRRFDRAESIYFGREEARSEKREANIKRNYELAVIDVPEKKPVRPPYDSCCFVVQLAEDNEEAIELLMETDQIPDRMSEKDKELCLQRVENAKKWLERFEPEDHLIHIQEDISTIEKDLTDGQTKVLRELRKRLKEREWTAEELQDEIYGMKDEYDISAGDLFRGIYTAILGKKSGPRAGQLIKAIGQERVVKILEDL